MQIKSLQLGDSPIRPAFYNTMIERAEVLVQTRKLIEWVVKKRIKAGAKYPAIRDFYMFA